MKKNYFLVLALFVVAITQAQIVNIPDANFKDVLVNQSICQLIIGGPLVKADANGDGEIQVSEAEAVISITGIVYTGALPYVPFPLLTATSLVGIEKFINLQALFIDSPNLVSLDISLNINLKAISINAPISTLNVDNNTLLTYLEIRGTQLTVLNLSANVLLEQFICDNNLLTTLNLDTNVGLKKISLDTNQLTSLSLTENILLEELNCNNNQLTSLNVNANPVLSLLQCSDNQITSLDLSNHASLNSLYCDNNQLTSISFGANTQLQYLYCNNNMLTNLDLTNFTSLYRLGCKNNLITSLDVSANLGLQRLFCDNNQLATLTSGANTQLQYLSCGNNLLTNLNLSTLTNLVAVECNDNQLSTLNLGASTTLRGVNANNNQLTGIDVSGLTSLTRLFCNNNQLTGININQNQALEVLKCNDNQLTSLDFNQITTLGKVECNNNQLTSLNLTDLSLLTLECNNNLLTTIDNAANVLVSLLCDDNNLSSLFLKNGYPLSFDDYVQAPIPGYNESEVLVLDVLFLHHSEDSRATSFNNNSNLAYICVDNNIFTYLDANNNTVTLNELVDFQQKVNDYGYTSCVVNSYCSFTPGGAFYTVAGQTRFDENSNGCDTSDPFLPNLKFDITDGVNTGGVIVDATGNYTIDVQAGIHTITPQLENPTYFTITPASIVVDFPTATSPYNQDFCVAPNGVHNDVEVTILPLTASKPGFDAEYQITYKNKGNTTLSGSVAFTFNDDVQDFVSHQYPIHKQLEV